MKENLRSSDADHQRGSLQKKLEDLTSIVQNGVFVDRDGPNADNGFIWRVTILDDARPIGNIPTMEMLKFQSVYSTVTRLIHRAQDLL